MRRSMKGRKYMSLVQYDVVLEERDEKDILAFQIDREKHPDGFVVNLNEPTGQQDFMNVFAVILRQLEREEIEFKLRVADGFDRALYKDVCKEYIDSLNAEIRDMRVKISNELDAN